MNHSTQSAPPLPDVRIITINDCFVLAETECESGAAEACLLVDELVDTRTRRVFMRAGDTLIVQICSSPKSSPFPEYHHAPVSSQAQIAFLCGIHPPWRAQL